MYKFWLALILGTITISAGLTYLKLHRGAQTISYPPSAAKAKAPQVEFINTYTPSDEKQMEVSANVVTLILKESYHEVSEEVSFKVKNAGEGELKLSLMHESCNCLGISIDGQRVSGTNHESKIGPGKTVEVRINFKPKFDPNRSSADKTRIRATFSHNDDRFSDNLHFEILTLVKPSK